MFQVDGLMERAVLSFRFRILPGPTEPADQTLRIIFIAADSTDNHYDPLLHKKFSGEVAASSPDRTLIPLCSSDSEDMLHLSEVLDNHLQMTEIFDLDCNP